MREMLANPVSDFSSVNRTSCFGMCSDIPDVGTRGTILDPGHVGDDTFMADQGDYPLLEKTAGFL